MTLNKLLFGISINAFDLILKR